MIAAGHAPVASDPIQQRNFIMERTLIILKPDAVQRGLVGELIALSLIHI